MENEAQESMNERVLREIADRFRGEVNQANVLLDWSVSRGKDVKPDLVARIKKGQGFLLSTPEVPIEEKAAFEAAYNELTKLVAPVTWTTLMATSDEHGRRNVLAPIAFFKG